LSNATELSDRWRTNLESWAIPDEVLANSPESPWVLPRQLFMRRAEFRLRAPTGPSFERAWEALEPPGSVLDVGSGAGTACLPLLARATAVTAVDTDECLLSVLKDSADHLGTTAQALLGRWPDVAGEVSPADVVVCHHVFYNVADIEPFLTELTTHALRRVVAEMTAVHPLSFLNPLWERFWGIVRPSVPTAEDMLALLVELGLDPSYELWSPAGEPELQSFDDLVEVTRRRLCLPPSRTAEVASALDEQRRHEHHFGDPRAFGADLMTIWWSGTAQERHLSV